MRRLVVPLAAMLVARSAHAGGAVELQWEAPASCPDRANVEARIAKLLQGADASKPVRAEARVRQSDGVFHLELVTTRDGVRGERVLDDPSCEALAESAALIVAMAVDPAAALEPSPPSTAAVVAPPSASSAPAAPIPPPAPGAAPPPVADASPDVSRGEPRPRPRLVLAAASDALVGVFPNAALGVGASLGVLPAPLRFDLGVRWSPRANHALKTPEGASGAFELVAANARAAWLWSRERWDLGPSLHAEAGVARGRGVGLSQSLEGSAPWLAAGPGVLATLRAGDVALSAEIVGLIPLTRPRFVVEGTGTVHTPAAVALRAGISAEVRF
ncbi:MAG: hypothetical protein HYV09_32470 [Deltaproteobacteria bacterium]|nr:hypothetical protein [Deltaproteobacteria bacterium]